MTHVCALVFFFLTSFPFQWCGRLRVPLLIVKHRCQVDLLIWDDLHFSNFFFYFFQVSLNKPSVESTKLSMDILPWWGEGRTLRKGLYPSQGWQHPSLGINPASSCKVVVRLLGSVLDPQWPWPSATLTFCASFAVAAVNLQTISRGFPEFYLRIFMQHFHSYCQNIPISFDEESVPNVKILRDAFSDNRNIMPQLHMWYGICQLWS